MKQYYVGVDIGGTKTAVGLFDERLQPLVVHTIPTNPQDGCIRLVERIGAEWESIRQAHGIAPESVIAAGVASPGPLDLKTGRIVHIPTMGFRDEPLVQLLETRLQLPVYLQNDTNAAALCESRVGDGQGCDTVVYITISTGIGCGIVVNGEIQNGAHDAAGELGHMCTERNGRPCACGKNGCLELYASGTSIALIASERLGETVDARQVFERARAGGETEMTVITEAADHLGYALAAVYQLLDPDVIVLGGSVTKDYDLLKPLLQNALERYMQAVPNRVPRIAVSRFDGQQVIRGAVWFACEQYRAKQVD